MTKEKRKYSFNLNDIIIVELTDRGLEKIKKEYPCYFKYNVDGNFLSIPIWAFANIFGSDLYMGQTNNPVEMNMHIRRSI